MRYCIISPFLKINNFSLQLDSFHFFLLVLTTILIASAGYVINDYFDVRTDRINKPEKVVIDSGVHRRSAILLHSVLSISGIIIGTYVSFYIKVLPLSFLFIFCSGLLWFYSTTYKRQLLIGNLIVSFMTGGVPLLVAIYEIPLLNRTYGSIMLHNSTNFNYIFFWILGFAFFAFLTNFIREIIKDTEDLEGDNAYGMSTIPIYLGIRYTKLILLTLIIFCLTALIWLLHFIMFSGESVDYITAVYFIILLIIPLIVLLFIIIFAKNKYHYHNASTLMKFIMLFGIMYSIIVRYIVLFKI